MEGADLTSILTTSSLKSEFIIWISQIIDAMDQDFQRCFADLNTNDIHSKFDRLQVESKKEPEKANEHKASLAFSRESKDKMLQNFDAWKTRILERVGEAINATSATRDNDADEKCNLVHTLSKDQLAVLCHSLLLLLLSLEVYDARSRVLMKRLYVVCGLDPMTLVGSENSVAAALVKAAKMNGDEESQKRTKENASSRKWKIGLAGVAGGVLVGITGGIAAPFVAAGLGTALGGIGLGGVAAGYLGVLASSSAVIGSLFGIYGGRSAGKMMQRFVTDVADFSFVPIHHEEGRLHVTIGVTGWLTEAEEVAEPWKVLSSSGEQYCLRWEVDALTNLGKALQKLLKSYAFSYVKAEIIKRTVLASLMTALWPLGLVKVSRIIDNPWNIAYIRAQKAGDVLADVIVNKSQGERPLTLIGFSLGARVIFSALQNLASRNALGLIENVYLMGAPVSKDTTEWTRARTVVSGRLVNCFSENDYILGFLFRSMNLRMGVAGLQAMSDVYGVENIDVSELIEGHLRYRYVLGKILRDRIGAEDIEEGAIIEQIGKETQASMPAPAELTESSKEESLDQVADEIEKERESRAALKGHGKEEDESEPSKTVTSK